MDQELKACPFCGGKAETVQFTRKRWTIECFADGCGAGIISQGDMQTAIAAWNTRAQLPSKGGEAVAWLQFVGDPEESGVLSFYPLAKHEVEAGWTETPLYTHPADQVAEGVRLDGLLRANLQMGRIYLHFKTTEQQHVALRELRALLNGGRS